MAAPATVSDLLEFNSTTGVGWEGGVQAKNCEPGDLPLVSSPAREARRFPGTDSVCGDVARLRRNRITEPSGTDPRTMIFRFR